MSNQDLRNIILALIAGIFLAFLLETSNQSNIDSSVTQTVHDTVLISTDCPEIVLNKKALLIGDSHSAFVRGWQTFLTDWTGLEIQNTAVEGKTTSWMKVKLVQNIDSTFEYCFIFGGGNDASASILPEEIFKNIEQMVDICIGFGVKPVVILGTSTEKVLKSTSGQWKEYSRIKTEYQNLIVEDLSGAIIIDTRDLIERSDCADFLCHMEISGHKKVALKVIQDMNLHRIEEK
jgi:hypothetical protein